MFRSFLLASALAVCVGGIGISPAAHASVVKPTTETQRIASADLVVRGTVVESWIEHNMRGLITTHFMVEADRVLKGDAPDGFVHLVVAGGEMATFRTVVQGAARYNVGEEVLLLLEYKEKFDNYVTVSMAKGRYTIRLDPVTQREIVQRPYIPSHMTYDHRFLPFPPEGEKVFADDLEDRIMGVVAGRIPVEVLQ
ncbi:MAG TPA: hypothetical protein DFR83_25105 [Deltaproteobacteria bacterium]|nr:hypothetical protein [Deltaproteobacteria bacterium]